MDAQYSGILKLYHVPLRVLALLLVALLCACSSDNAANLSGDSDPDRDLPSEMEQDLLPPGDRDADPSEIEEMLESVDGDQDSTPPDGDSELDADSDLDPDLDIENEFELELEIETDLESDFSDNDILEVDIFDNSGLPGARPACAPDLAERYPNTWQRLYSYPIGGMAGSLEPQKPVLLGADGQILVSSGANSFAEWDGEYWKNSELEILQQDFTVSFPHNQASKPGNMFHSLNDLRRVYVFVDDHWETDLRPDLTTQIYAHAWQGEGLWITSPWSGSVYQVSDAGTVAHTLQTEDGFGLLPTAIASDGDTIVVAGPTQYVDGAPLYRVYLAVYENETWTIYEAGDLSHEIRPFPIKILTSAQRIDILDQYGDLFSFDRTTKIWTRSYLMEGCSEEAFLSDGVLDANNRLHVTIQGCDHYRIFSEGTQTYAFTQPVPDYAGNALNVNVTAQGKSIIAFRRAIYMGDPVTDTWDMHGMEFLPHQMEFEQYNSTMLYSIDFVYSNNALLIGRSNQISWIELLFYKNGCFQVTPHSPLDSSISHLHSIAFMGNKTWMLALLEREDPHGSEKYIDSLMFWDHQMGWQDEFLFGASNRANDYNQLDEHSAIFLGRMGSARAIWYTDDAGNTWNDITPLNLLEIRDYMDRLFVTLGTIYVTIPFNELEVQHHYVYRIDLQGEAELLTDLPERLPIYGIHKLPDGKEIYFGNGIRHGYLNDFNNMTQLVDWGVYPFAQMPSGEILFYRDSSFWILSPELAITHTLTLSSSDVINAVILDRPQGGSDVYIVAGPEIYHRVCPSGWIHPPGETKKSIVTGRTPQNALAAPPTKTPLAQAPQAGNLPRRWSVDRLPDTGIQNRVNSASTQ